MKTASLKEISLQLPRTEPLGKWFKIWFL